MDYIKKIYIKYKEIINYLIVGMLTTLVSLLTYYVCTTLFLDPQKPFELQIANIISWILSVTFAYFTNRKYVFESKNKNKIKEGFKFFSSRIATLLLDMFIMWLGVTVLLFNDKLIKIISQILIIISNYVLSKFLVFKKADK